MKVLMVMQHINFFRNLDTLVRELDARGHQVVMLHGTRLDDDKMRAKLARKRETMIFMGRGIEVAQADLPSVTAGYRPEPAERWHRRLRSGREVINRTIYMRKGHPSPERVTEGLDKRLPPRVRRLMESWLGGRVLRQPFVLRLWRCIEAVSPPSRTVVSLLEEIRPDVVLVSPTVWPKNPVEADYIRAARTLGIPTIGYLNSWDNLTSKGTVHVIPDAYVVWNEALANEAVEIHDIPRDAIRITGAPHLDRFFEMQPTVPRAEMCREMGCDGDAPYVVYLCSSRTLISSEVHIVTDLADALAGAFPASGPPTLVVRPHPVNPDPWESYSHPGVVVYPKVGDQADSPESWQEYYNQLSWASCFVGLNTTAFLEAAIVDRPCLTIVADEFHAVQGWTGHFRHLLEADFLEVARDAREVAERVVRILAGEDAKAAEREAFRKWFLRPSGVDKPVTLGVADLMETVAGIPLSTADPVVEEAASGRDLALAAKDATR